MPARKFAMKIPKGHNIFVCIPYITNLHKIVVCQLPILFKSGILVTMKAPKARFKILPFTNPRTGTPS